MTQTKIQAFLLFVILPIIWILLLFANTYNPNKVQVEEVKQVESPVAEVADQKSVIDEQSFIPRCTNVGHGDIPRPTLTLEAKKTRGPYASVIDGLTKEEKELICRISYLECGNQCEEGQRAVIEVILNRLISERWPDTIEEVLSAPHQFSTWHRRDKVTDEQVAKMNRILRIVYSEEEKILSSEKYVYFNCAEHFGNDCVRIQGHWFWK